MGLVVSPMMNYQYREGTSIKLVVFPHYEGADENKPITFTCDGMDFFIFFTVTAFYLQNKVLTHLELYLRINYLVFK